MLRKTLFVVLMLTLLGMMLPTASAQGCSGTVYVVRTGDTLASISRAFGVSMDAIAAANGISNYNYIQIASTLCIPAAGTGGVAPAPVTQPTYGTGGPTTSTGTSTVTTTGGTVILNTGTEYPVAPTTLAVVPVGTLDVSGYATTATVSLDALNNIFHVSTDGMIPNSYVTVYVSAELGDLSGGPVGYLKADRLGHVEGYIYIPILYPVSHQYVMVRAWDKRMTWGFFDMPRRFP